MGTCKRILLVVGVILITCVEIPKLSFAIDHGDFDPFVTVDLSAPDGVKTIADPTGSAPDKEVYSFTLKDKYCSQTKYEN